MGARRATLDAAGWVAQQMALPFPQLGAGLAVEDREVTEPASAADYYKPSIFPSPFPLFLHFLLCFFLQLSS